MDFPRYPSGWAFREDAKTWFLPALNAWCHTIAYTFWMCAAPEKEPFPFAREEPNSRSPQRRPARATLVSYPWC